MTLETRVNNEGTSSRVHSGDVHRALDFLDGQLSSVVPMLVILVLTNESNGALSVVLIEGRHVEIINEVEELELADRSEDLTGSLLKLLLEDLLKKHGVGIEVEVDGLLQVLLLVLISSCAKLVEETLNDLGLTTTSLSNKERRVANLNEVLHDLLGGDSVDGGHGEAGNRLSGVDHIGAVCGNEFVPLFEFGVLEVDVVIEDSLCGGESGSLKLLLPPGREFLTVLTAVLKIEASTEAPDTAEDKHEGESLDSGVLEDRLKEFTEGSDHADFDLRNQVLEGSLDVFEGLFNVLIEVALELLLALIIVVLLLQP